MNSSAPTATKMRTWMTLLVVLLLLSPPLLVHVEKPSPTRIMEVLSFLTSQETWMNMQEDADAWKMPTWNGRPRIQKPDA